MTAKKIIIIVVVVLLLFAVVAGSLIGYVFYRTISNSGEKAVASMTENERRFLEEKLFTIDSSMGFQEIVEILGFPDRPSPQMRPTWYASGGNPLSQVAVYFWDNEPFRIRWLKVGFFVWERDLSTESGELLKDTDSGSHNEPD